MIRILQELENYLLITDGLRFAVVERRAGLYYRLLHRAPHGVPLAGPGARELFSSDTLDSEAEARRRLEYVAMEYCELADHLR